jgi:hypothetical protein
MARIILVALLLIAFQFTLPASAADLNKVNEAIAKGGGYLKQMYGQNLAAPPGQHGLGSTALSGLAMLEAKVKPDDPALANVTRFVRSAAPGETRTYNISLAILYLDRLGDTRDELLIQMLGVRLYSGLMASGGWGYNCGSPAGGVTAPGVGLPGGVVAPQVPVQPPAAIPRKKPRQAEGFPEARKKEDPARPNDDVPAKLHPEAAQYYLAVRQAIRGGRPNQGTDNSNTQFGLIALWVASRHGVPAEDAFALIEARFLTSQNTGDGGWGYSHGVSDRSTASMTCAGLLGLAVGQARGPVGVSRTKEPTDPNDPFFNPKKDGKGIPDGGPRPIVAADRKRSIDMGLKAIGAVIRQTGGARAAPPGNLPGVAIPGLGGQRGGLAEFVGLGNEYYLLWSVERVAMAYGLDTIGDADWYEWGCSHLLPTQQANGSWDEGNAGHGYGSDVNTSFAILFLSRSNFVRDLSRKITGQVKDPGTTELRGTKGRPPLFAPPEKGGSPGAGEPPPASPPPEPMEKTPDLPGVQGPTDPLADALVKASGADFDTKLKTARDTKGTEHTASLVHAIPRLDGDRQKQAREALAERLTRMTATTLRAMLKDPDAELRRAACLACAMKDDRGHIPDLIERITDQSDIVVPAARAGLKSLTEKDFGPPPGADEAAKAKAQADWKNWYASQGKP